MISRLLVAFLLLLGRPALADPALWSVQGPHATVYLFGTIHVLKPGVAWETPAIRHAFDAADECWLEIGAPTDNKAVAALIATRGVDIRHSLSAELSVAGREQLRALAGSDFGKVEHMRPWLAMAFLTIKTAERAGYDGMHGVEEVLRAQAQAAGKPVRGLETTEGQFRLLADIPDREMLAVLEGEIGEDGDGARLDQLVDLWRTGNLDALGKRINEAVEAKSPSVARKLITVRNQAFADAVAGMALGDKTVFVAVGAGHLVGPEGVPALLALKKLAVSRVE